MKDVMRDIKMYVEEVGIENCEELKKKYATDGIIPARISHHFYQIKVGEARNLVRRMEAADASEEELIRAKKYFLVILDAFRYNLDFNKAYSDFSIKKLIDKYQKK